MTDAPGYHAHPDWAAFLAAIRANPADDLARLVAADWLDEHGYGERAELVRLMVAAKKHKDGRGIDQRTAAAERICSLYTTVMPDWFHTLPNSIRAPASPYRSVQFDRGFVDGFTGPFAAWTAHAARLLPESVGLTVRLTDRPVVEYAGDAPADGVSFDLHRLNNPRSRLVGEDGWRGEWSHGHRTAEELLRRQWPEVSSWEVPSAFSEHLTTFPEQLFGVPAGVAGLTGAGSYAEYHAALQQFRDRFTP